MATYNPFFSSIGGSQFNLNPNPQSGSGAFGAVPGAIGMPDPFGDLSNVYPNLSGSNTAASQAILSRLRGELSPDTINAIRDAAATFGVGSGMPGGGLSRNLTLRDLGRTREDLISRGLQEYNALLPTISGTQTVRPETQVDIATQNALNRAAPNPTAAANYAQQMFDKYLKLQSAPAGRSYSPWGPNRNRNQVIPAMAGGVLPSYF